MEHTTNNNNKKHKLLEYYVATTHDLLRSKKRLKQTDLNSITYGLLLKKKVKINPDRPNKQKYSNIKILWDSGCAATIINSYAVDKLKQYKDKNKTKWKTKVGTFVTKRLCDIEFQMPAFHDNRVVKWTAHVHETDKDHSTYDLIIGRDMLSKLGMDILFSKAMLCWDGAEVPMRSLSKLDNNWEDQLLQESLLMEDPTTTDAARIQAILDAKYCPADLQQISENCKNLDKKQQCKLKKVVG